MALYMDFNGATGDINYKKRLPDKLVRQPLLEFTES